MPEGVGRRPLGRRHSPFRHGALGHHDDWRIVALEAPDDVVAHLVQVKLDLGDQDHVGPAGEPGVERDPAGVPSHHLADQRPLVALGGRMEAVDRGHRDVDRRVEAEGVVGGGEVVVDRLRNADYLDSPVEQLGRSAEGVLAADCDQAIDTIGFQVLRDRLRPAVLLERIGPGRAEDRPAARQDPADLRDAERPAVVLEGAAPAVAIADELMPVLPHPLANDGADHGVQTWAVTSSGENAYPHQAINLPGRAAGPEISVPRPRRSAPPSRRRSECRRGPRGSALARARHRWTRSRRGAGRSGSAGAASGL